MNDIKYLSFSSHTPIPKSPKRIAHRGKENESLSSMNLITPKKVIVTENKKDTDNSLKIFLRARPLKQNETESCLDVSGNSIILTPPNSVLNGRGNKKVFDFENVFGPDSTQEEVFQKSFLSLLPCVIEQRDILVFSYGVTGAGKTFTIEGSPSNPGLLPRALKSILSCMKESRPIDFSQFEEMKVSCFEIFNEKIYDLLVSSSGKLKKPTKSENKQQLNLTRTVDGRTIVEGSTEWTITEESQITELLLKANTERHKAETTFNHSSSRSHVVYRISLINRNGITVYISIVDLAGCERTKAIGDERFRESCNINKSMLVLGKCIRSLATKNQAIPYRESIITRLFKDFFESPGKCAVASVIVNVTPSIEQFEDTSFSLGFAVDASECYTSSNYEEPEINQSPYLVSQIQNYLSNVENTYKNQVYSLMERTRSGNVVFENIQKQIINSEMEELRRENIELKEKLVEAQKIIQKLSKDYL